jgi:agmatinase
MSNLENFDPSGVGLKNGKFIGLPFGYEDASLILQPVPWDATVSYQDGTHSGPDNILEASSQLDLFDPDAPEEWRKGIFFESAPAELKKKNAKTRKWAAEQIALLEAGDANEKKIHRLTDKVNARCEEMNEWVYHTCKHHLENGKKLGLIGGDHSSPLGFYRAMHEVHGRFGLLVIDAHLDLRTAYEGFAYSHASIFQNTIASIPVQKVIQVGIRDFCDEELAYIQEHQGTIEPYFDHQLRDRKARGESWHQICEEIGGKLPHNIVISVDIDGLLPYLCPNTGTPVPGGLEFNELTYLLKSLVDSGKHILGFDLCEVAGKGNDWDGNVGARVCYKLSGQLLRSSVNKEKYDI